MFGFGKKSATGIHISGRTVRVAALGAGRAGVWPLALVEGQLEQPFDPDALAADDRRLELAETLARIADESGIDFRNTCIALDRRLASDAHELYTQALASHPGEQGSASQALASAAGRVAALDAGVTLYLRKAGLEESTPQPKSALDLCRPTVGIDAIEEYRHMPPFLKTFLWEFASVEYKPPDCRGLCGTALQRRASEPFQRENQDVGHKTTVFLRSLERTRFW